MQFNINKATRRLKAKFPNRSVCVAVQSWHHENGNRGVEFWAAVSPGFTGKKCSSYEFDSADELTGWIETVEQETEPCDTP